MTEPVILKKDRGTNRAVVRLQKRVEDREDLHDLETAITENAGKPLIPWEQAKAELDLEFTLEFEESIRKSERDVAKGKSARVREPEGS